VGVDGLNNSIGRVVLKDWNGFIVVGRQSLGEGLGGIILALHQGLAGGIILHALGDRLSIGTGLHGLGRCIFDVVGSSGLFVDPSSSDALLKDGIWDLELDDLCDAGTFLREHLVEGLSLGKSSGESIKNKSVLAIVFLDAVTNNSNNNLVADKSTGVHNGLGLLSNLSSSGNGSTEHITGGEGWNTQKVLDFGSVGSLSGSRRSTENKLILSKPET